MCSCCSFSCKIAAAKLMSRRLWLWSLCLLLALSQCVAGVAASLPAYPQLCSACVCGCCRCCGCRCEVCCHIAGMVGLAADVVAAVVHSSCSDCWCATMLAGVAVVVDGVATVMAWYLQLWFWQLPFCSWGGCLGISNCRCVCCCRSCVICSSACL